MKLKTLNPAATAMTALLTRTGPALGVFWPAGWPTTATAVNTLRAMIEAGAQYVEIGAGTAARHTDRPAGRSALADAITTASEIARPHGVPVVVRARWDALARIGPVGAATALARAGAGAVVIPDLPRDHVDLWANAARWAGLLTPRVAFRRATDARLAAVCRAATGWVFAPAADTPAGFPGGLGLAGRRDFVPRIRAATELPVVIGAGRCEVRRAVQLSRCADAVLVGPVPIRHMQNTPGPDGRTHAVAYVTDLAKALRAEHAALTELTGATRARPAGRS